MYRFQPECIKNEHSLGSIMEDNLLKISDLKIGI